MSAFLDEVKALPAKLAQDRIVEEFVSVGDVFSQYAMLVELSAELPVMSDEDKARCTLVDKCQSQVWVDLEYRQGGAHLLAESDTLIVRGVLLLIAATVEGCTHEDLSDMHIDFVQRSDLHEAFSSDRLNGFKEIEKTIREHV